MAPPKDFKTIKSLYSKWRTEFDLLSAREIEVYGMQAHMSEIYARMLAGEQIPADENEWLQNAEAEIEVDRPMLELEINSFREYHDNFVYRVRQFVPVANTYIPVSTREEIMCLDFIGRHGAGHSIYFAARRGLAGYAIAEVEDAFNRWIGANFSYHRLYVLQRDEAGSNTYRAASRQQEQERGFNPNA